MSSSEITPISFESSTSNDKRREEKRLKQEKLLVKAKSDFERAERLKQEKKERGETNWLLPHLDEKLSGKKEKKKEKKKKKKSKKNKKDKDGSDSD